MCCMPPRIWLIRSALYITSVSLLMLATGGTDSGLGVLLFVLVGVLPDSILGLPLALYGILQAAVFYLRKHRINAKYRAAQELESASIL